MPPVVTGREVNDAHRAYLTERLEEARRIFLVLKSRLMELLEHLDKAPAEGREEVYRIAGDHLTVIPQELGELETALDAAAYVETDMARRRLKERLPGAVVEEIHQLRDVRLTEGKDS